MRVVQSFQRGAGWRAVILLDARTARLSERERDFAISREFGISPSDCYMEYARGRVHSERVYANVLAPIESYPECPF